MIVYRSDNECCGESEKAFSNEESFTNNDLTEVNDEEIDNDNDVEFDDDIEDDDGGEFDDYIDNAEHVFHYNLGMNNEAADEDITIPDLTINDNGNMTCNEIFNYFCHNRFISNK